MARRPAPLAIAVILTLAAQVSYTVPARATRELRAAACCATHCSHPASPTQSSRCCRLGQDGGTTAVVTPVAAHSEAPLGALALRGPIAAAPLSTARLLGAHDRALGRAGPVFLLTRTLLL